MAVTQIQSPQPTGALPPITNPQASAIAVKRGDVIHEQTVVRSQARASAFAFVVRAKIEAKLKQVAGTRNPKTLLRSQESGRRMQTNAGVAESKTICRHGRRKSQLLAAESGPCG